MAKKTLVTMRSWWDNKSWRLGNIGEQNFCIVRETKLIKINWCLILFIILPFQNSRIFYQIHLFLTPDREHSKFFENVAIIGLKKGKSLKDILVRAKVPPLKIEDGCCGPCNKPRWEICKHITKTNQFWVIIYEAFIFH